MDRATSNSAADTARGGLRGRVRRRYAPLLLAAGMSAILPLSRAAEDFRVQAQQSFARAARTYEAQPTNLTAACEFAIACFEFAEFATNSAERALLAEQGIDASQLVLAREPDSVPGQYALGLNLGQLARTRGIGALKLVNRMEDAFLRACKLEPGYDYAGAHRCLALLYRDAPAIASVGSRSKARHHLHKAVELAPDYPGNYLNLIESLLKWGDRNGAGRELKALESRLPAAREALQGAEWAPDWADWDRQFQELRVRIGKPPPVFKSPRSE